MFKFDFDIDDIDEESGVLQSITTVPKDKATADVAKESSEKTPSNGSFVELSIEHLVRASFSYL